MTAPGFLGVVVEAVPETWADPGLELDGHQELAVGDDEQVPLLLGPVVASERGASADGGTRQASVDQDVGEEDFHGTQLPATGDRAAGAGVNLPGCGLLLLLAVPRVPESLHGVIEARAEAC